MPDTMDRRDFLIRLAIGAAFALAGVPLLGEWLREWAERRERNAYYRQRHATFLRHGHRGTVIGGGWRLERRASIEHRRGLMALIESSPVRTMNLPATAPQWSFDIGVRA